MALTAGHEAVDPVSFDLQIDEDTADAGASHETALFDHEVCPPVAKGIVQQACQRTRSHACSTFFRDAVARGKHARGCMGEAPVFCNDKRVKADKVERIANPSDRWLIGKDRSQIILVCDANQKEPISSIDDLRSDTGIQTVCTQPDSCQNVDLGHLCFDPIRLRLIARRVLLL